MPALYLVIPLALLFAMLAIGAFVWSARSGQFDDLDGPAERILHEDDGERDDTRSN
ncbi:MAG: cbb3-type cytochrome oxidase assembly protein CcoS [Phycisphaerales bacterium]|nr:cbb3-type cytochrome oxidase assembly protein CcoS [Phycisphaerales bacterium]MDG1978829.1 cbb3-type cytochrome oxidase assembly protein CcoS [Phycisphaerales bacterium]